MPKGGYWDKEKLVSEIERSAGMVYKARILEKDGKVYGEVRTWFEKDGEWFPTKKGLVVPVDSLKDVRAMWDMIINELEEEEDDEDGDE